MKRVVLTMVLSVWAVLAVASSTRAQAVNEPETITVLGTVGGTFGSSSGASFGAEVNYQLGTEWQAFAELGHMRNVAPSLVEERGNLIAGVIGGQVDAASRATFLDAGIKYLFVPFGGGYTPYAGLGFGVARVKNDVAFTVGGTELTEDRLLQQYGVLLGNDLAGTTTKPLVLFALGIAKNLGARYTFDVSYRYGFIFSKSGSIEDDKGIHANRLQVGFGLRF